MKRRYVGCGIGLLALVLLGRCGSVDVGNLNPDDSAQAICADQTATFTQALTIFETAGCTASSCHGGGSSAGGLNLDTDDGAGGEGAAGVYGEATGNNRVDTSQPSSSPLLTRSLGGNDHAVGFSSIDNPDYQGLFCWIAAGATN